MARKAKKKPSFDPNVFLATADNGRQLQRDSSATEKRRKRGLQLVGAPQACSPQAPGLPLRRDRRVIA